MTDQEERDLTQALRRQLAVCECCGKTNCSFVLDENASKLAQLRTLTSEDVSSPVYGYDP